MNAEYKYNKKATEQMDVYSFGVVLLELVTGRQAEHRPVGEKEGEHSQWSFPSLGLKRLGTLSTTNAGSSRHCPPMHFYNA